MLNEFDLFLKANNADLFQAGAWGEFQAKIPSRGKFWALTTKGKDEGGDGKGEITGAAMVVRHKLPFGLCWLGIERGPILAKKEAFADLWEQIVRLARTEKAVFIRIEPREGDDLSYLNKKWRLAHAHYQPEWTLKINLTGSEEEILAQMKQKGRYNIKVAEKAGVKVREGETTKDVKDFYTILQKTGERDGFFIHDSAYYERLLTAARENDFGKLYLAEHNGRVIGGILVTFYGNTGMYYYGASDHELRALMAPYLLQWTAIREAKKRSLKWYDFLGIAPPNDHDHPWVGITQFKTRFGGEVIKYAAAHEFVFKPFWYGLIKLRKRFYLGR